MMVIIDPLVSVRKPSSNRLHLSVSSITKANAYFQFSESFLIFCDGHVTLDQTYKLIHLRVTKGMRVELVLEHFSELLI